MEVAPWLERAAAAAPDRLALAAPGARWSYRQLLERARAVASALAAAGVGRGDRVALAFAPSAEWVAAFHGVLLLGAVAVPVDPRLTAPERAGLLSEADLVLDEGPRGRPARPCAPRPHRLDTPALLVRTSGSTGVPRPVELTYGNWLANALGSAVALGLDPAERWACPLPLSHVGGLGVLLRSAIYATGVILQPAFDAERLARALVDDAATLVSVVPTMLARLLDAGLRRPPALRCALVGGGPIAPALLERAVAAEIPVAQTYGMTEACSQVAVSAIGSPQTAGAPLPTARVAVANDGEILVAGPTVAPASLGGDGWLHTGDLGALEQGLLRVSGRRSEIIISGGENVAPAEVEAVLATHPGVAEAAVYGQPDPEWGEAVSALVVPRPGGVLDAEELRAWARGRLAGFKVPKCFAFAAQLPRTASGKLARRELGRG